MMKGYRPEEARAAVHAGRTRRTSEAATRPPLAATAYASTRDKVCNLVTQLFTLLHFEALLPKHISYNSVNGKQL